MPENIYLLKIFEGIEKNTVDFIINNCEIRSYNKGAILMSEGDNSNQEGYILKSGKVSINIHEQDIKKLDEMISNKWGLDIKSYSGSKKWEQKDFSEINSITIDN